MKYMQKPGIKKKLQDNEEKSQKEKICTSNSYEEENTEAVWKPSWRKVENTQYIEYENVHRVGKRDRNTRKPRTIIGHCLRFTDRESLADVTISTARRASVLTQIYLSK